MFNMFDHITIWWVFLSDSDCIYFLSKCEIGIFVVLKMKKEATRLRNHFHFVSYTWRNSVQHLLFAASDSCIGLVKRALESLLLDVVVDILVWHDTKVMQLTSTYRPIYRLTPRTGNLLVSNVEASWIVDSFVIHKELIKMN